MTIVDWLLVGYVGLGALRGLRQGFIVMIFGIFSYVVALSVAAHYDGTLAQWANRQWDLTTRLSGLFAQRSVSGLAAPPSLARHLLVDAAFVVIVLAIEMGARAVARPLLGRMAALTLGPFDKLLGLALGAAEHVALIAVVILLVMPFTGVQPFGHLGMQVLRLPPFQIIQGWIRGGQGLTAWLL